MRIQRPKMRIWFTALNDCEPPLTSITAKVLPCVGRTAPNDNGIQSIWLFMMPVMAPCRSGEHQTMPSDHVAKLRSSCTLGWLSGAASGCGRPKGSNTLTSAPMRSNKRAASKVSNLL